MRKSDLFCREALDEIVDAASMKAYRNHMIVNTGLCAVADTICISQAVEHATQGNYNAAFTLTLMGALTSLIGYYEARRAHVLQTTPLEELKNPVLQINSVDNPFLDYLEK